MFFFRVIIIHHLWFSYRLSNCRGAFYDFISTKVDSLCKHPRPGYNFVERWPTRSQRAHIKCVGN